MKINWVFLFETSGFYSNKMVAKRCNTLILKICMGVFEACDSKLIFTSSVGVQQKPK